MGREVRRVPQDWQHPKRKNGDYAPLLDGGYSRSASEWDEGHRKWAEGFRENWGDGDKWIPRTGDEASETFEEWYGSRPEESEYMPDWPEAERTHLQMYENVSEGTPISPVMETPEELARWLAENRASACGNMTATYEQWLATIRNGYAPSMIAIGGKLMSGVEGMTQ